MEIKNCTITDIEEIFRLYRIATEFQKTRFTVFWPEFERSLIEIEIAENRQWKLIIDGAIACNWAITFSDPKIWEERNADSAIYIHRITTNPDYRGRNFVLKIVEWAKDFAAKNNIDFIRLDTIGNNEKLIEHYKKAGFDFLGMFKLKDTRGLPEHYNKAFACLFEISLKTIK